MHAVVTTQHSQLLEHTPPLRPEFLILAALMLHRIKHQTKHFQRNSTNVVMTTGSGTLVLVFMLVLLLIRFS